MVPRALAGELARMSPYDPRYVERLLSWSRDNAQRVEGLYVAPWSAAVRARMETVVVDLAERYDLDGIHLDYIRFPSSQFDYSRGALERFRAWAAPFLSSQARSALDEAYETDPFAYTDALPERWDEFRRAQITGLVARVHDAVKAIRPRLVVSAAVFADEEDAYANRFQDWSTWLDRGIVDVVAPMAYTTENDRFTNAVRDASAAAGRPDRLWAGIGAWVNGYEGTVAKIDIARRQGAGGVILFSYDWAAREAPAAGRVPFLVRIGRERFGR
jgi:uncharacterized lipoprotein YddW (UPF0748 family)